MELFGASVNRKNGGGIALRAVVFAFGEWYCAARSDIALRQWYCFAVVNGRGCGRRTYYTPVPSKVGIMSETAEEGSCQ